MSPGEPPRDWDRELAAIDKLIATGAGDAPAAPAPAGKRGAAPKPVPAGGGGPVVPAGGRRATFLTWFRVILGVLLGAALTQWPYEKGCGLPLFGYLGGVGALVAVSLSGMTSSWRSRSGFAHLLSVGLLFWGATFAAMEVLPRIGYAKRTAAWLCETGPAQPAQRPARPQTPPVSPSTAPNPSTPLTPSTPQRRDSL